jgi:hypothetical protein
VSANALLRSLQSAAKKSRVPAYSGADGVHPSVAGVSSLCANFTFKYTASGLCAHSNAGAMAREAAVDDDSESTTALSLARILEAARRVNHIIGRWRMAALLYSLPVWCTAVERSTCKAGAKEMRRLVTSHQPLVIATSIASFPASFPIV